MINASARLARQITWASSKQSYITARLLADRDLADDCLRAYAYFRWADDIIDITLATPEERFDFIARQKTLVERLYRHERPADLTVQETMLADLIAHDRGQNSGLRSFIVNFMAVIEFDAHRRDRLISQRELAVYTTCLGTAVMDGLLYFIGNGHPYLRTSDRNMAVVGAHLTHMLRDTLEDIPAGFVNVPAEDIDRFGIELDQPASEPFRRWVRGQVEQARDSFREGQGYIDSLDVLRAKLAGNWYCARFHCILQSIERDGYTLRADYPERRCLSAWLRMFALAGRVTWEHLRQRFRSTHVHFPTGISLDSRQHFSS